MARAQVKIVNAQGRSLAILENAFSIGHKKSANQLFEAWFSLPADDPKLEYCKPLAYVEIWEAGERVELFRILPSEMKKEWTSTVRFECEHVVATLIDDVLFQYHEIGGTGVNTTTVLNYILSKQTVARWVLKSNEFSRQYLYKWENENLLGALFSVPNRFLEPYEWAYDTTVYPWEISLKQVVTTPKSYVRYRKNLKSITKSVDTTQLCTRLYPLGYGEGVNQLDIRSVNNGVPYLNAATQGEYGVINRIWVDRRFEDPQSLKETAQAMLNELMTPYISYEVDAVDISSITNDTVDKFVAGTYTRVIDEEIKEDFQALILTVVKEDIDDVPAVTLTIANKPLDVAQSIANLADRQRINEVYSQGATNLLSQDFADNCDPQNPATIEFYIPEETVRINKMVMNMRTEPFRAYSRAIEGGGEMATSTDGGGGSSQTSSAGGGTSTSTSSGGGTSTTSGSGGGTTQTSAPGSWSYSPAQPLLPDFMEMAGDPPHAHAMGSVRHTHNLNFPNHSHSISVPDHTHGLNVPNHSHNVNIPIHSHQLNLPNHTHEIEYGIFQAPEMPTQVGLRIDGNLVPGTNINRANLNIIPYLAKDGGGKVLRGWHTITATPNQLARIVMSLATQIFVQSRGGGDF